MMNRKAVHSLHPVYVSDTWYYFHGASKEHSHTNATVSDLLASVSSRRVTQQELVSMYMQRRLLCRGTKGVADYQLSPLRSFAADEVIGFQKLSGVATGKVFRTAVEKAKSADSLLATIDELKKQCDELNAKIAALESLSSDAASNRLAELKEQLAIAQRTLNAHIQNVRGQHLRGAVFDAKEISQVKVFSEKLEKEGAIRFGTTVVCSLSASLPHPYHPAIQVGGSTGSGALTVALGLSSLSLGSNGGGSNRIPAGLLGLSGFYDGDNGGFGAIARTPLDNALIVNATQDAPERYPQLMERFRQPLEGIRIGYMSELAPEFDNAATPYNFPAFDGASLPPPMPLHASVRDSFDVAVRTLQSASDFAPLLRDADRTIPEISHTFFASWMNMTESLSEEEWAARDPYSVPAADFRMITQAATKWKAKRKLRTEEYKARRTSHVATASESGCEYLLTPLLRLPYWKAQGPPKNGGTRDPLSSERVYNELNTNPDVPFLPKCYGKDPQGNPMDVVDPSFNPYCVLANHWGTPSVTIPFSVCAPHPIRRNEEQTMPYALVLTTTPMHHTGMKATKKSSLMELLFVAHKLSVALRELHPPPPYIKELWELSGVAPDNKRVTWPTDFTSYGD